MRPSNLVGIANGGCSRPSRRCGFIEPARDELDRWFELRCVDATGRSRLAVPLQNRVSPFGELCAFCARGLFMGNRGGRFHTEAKTLRSRRWASRQWICCVLDFKGRRRDVWGRFYTELFFLDEPTALAAGHR